MKKREKGAQPRKPHRTRRSPNDGCRSHCWETSDLTWAFSVDPRGFEPLTFWLPARPG